MSDTVCLPALPALPDALTCNAGQRIVNVEELNCSPVKVVADNNAVTSTLLGILIVLTATLIAVVLWINRITVGEKVEPLSDLIQPLSA